MGLRSPGPKALLKVRLAAALATVAVCAGGVTACGGSSAGAATPPPAGTAVTVDLRNVSFNPTSVSVHSGQTVAWHFDDGSIPHNVTGAGWSSPDRTSGFYTHAFPAPGTYTYRCTIHSNMTGQVVVAP